MLTATAWELEGRGPEDQPGSAVAGGGATSEATSSDADKAG